MGKKIIIDLDDSLYAHGFEGDSLIHQKKLDKAMNLIKEQVNKAKSSDEKSDLYLDHNYTTIGVFGDRGSGKTSFLISLLTKCIKDTALASRIKVLRIIDPTLVEHKRPLMLSIIATINGVVALLSGEIFPQ